MHFNFASCALDSNLCCPRTMVIYAHVAYYLAWPAGRRAGGFWSDYVTGDEVEYYYEIQVGCCVLV